MAANPDSKPKRRRKQTTSELLALLDLIPNTDGSTSLPPTFVCMNPNHNPHHIAVGLAQKKEFNIKFGCKKWRPKPT